MSPSAPDLAAALDAWIAGDAAALEPAQRGRLAIWCREILAHGHAKVVEIAAAPVRDGFIAVAIAKSSRLPFAWAFAATRAAAVAAIRRDRARSARIAYVTPDAIGWLQPAHWLGNMDNEAAIRCAYRAFCQPATRSGKTAAMLHGFGEMPWTTADFLDHATMGEELGDEAPPEDPEPEAPAPPIGEPPAHGVPLGDVEHALDEAAAIATRWRRLLERSRARAARLDTRARRWRRVATLLRGELRAALNIVAALTRAAQPAPASPLPAVPPAPTSTKAPAPPAPAAAKPTRAPRPKRAPVEVPAKPKAPRAPRVKKIAAPEIATTTPAEALAVPQNDGALASIRPLDVDLEIEPEDEIEIEDPGDAEPDEEADTEPAEAIPVLAPANVRRRIEERLRESRERQKLLDGYYLEPATPRETDDEDAEPEESDADDDDEDD